MKRGPTEHRWRQAENHRPADRLNSSAPPNNGKTYTYTVTNARFGFRNDAWDVAFYVNNLTDDHQVFALDQERGTLARVGWLVGQPRTYGILVRANF